MTMFKVKMKNEVRPRFGDYTYEILRDDRVVAYFLHDFRGESFFFRFLDGTEEIGPFESVMDILTGGGVKMKGLSTKASQFLSDRL